MTTEPSDGLITFDQNLFEDSNRLQPILPSVSVKYYKVIKMRLLSMCDDGYC